MIGVVEYTAQGRGKDGRHGEVVAFERLWMLSGLSPAAFANDFPSLFLPAVKSLTWEFPKVRSGLTLSEERLKLTEAVQYLSLIHI